MDEENDRTKEIIEPAEAGASAEKAPGPGALLKRFGQKLTGRRLAIIIGAAALLVILILLLVLHRTGSREKKLDLAVTVTEEGAELDSGKKLDLTGTVLAPADAFEQLQEEGADRVLCTLKVCGTEVDSQAEELDLTGAAADDIDLQEIRDAALVMPKLTKVLLPDETDYTDEELSALNDELNGIRVVWTVHLVSFDLRTDATYFCANANSWEDPVLNEDAPKLAYCTDMVALDLGHKQLLSDFTFLTSMPHLKYLIVGDTGLCTLEQVGQLKELVYLEVFMTYFTDITPITGLTNLQYLNIGYTYHYDRTPLEQMTWLKYLWYPGNYLSADMKSELKSALPDTEIYLVFNDGDGSTGGGWRETDGYYAMRDALHMPYME